MADAEGLDPGGGVGPDLVDQRAAVGALPRGAGGVAPGPRFPAQAARGQCDQAPGRGRSLAQEKEVQGEALVELVVGDAGTEIDQAAGQRTTLAQRRDPEQQVGLAGDDGPGRHRPSPGRRAGLPG